METLEVIKKAEGGRVTIDIPQTLEGKALIIRIDEQKPEGGDFRKFSEMNVEERLRELKQYQGTAKYPDADVSKYDVYEQ
jgi:hypothetical protein